MNSNAIQDVINDYIIDNRLNTDEIKDAIKSSLDPYKENPIVMYLENELSMDFIESFESTQKYFLKNFPHLFSDVVSLSDKDDIMLVNSPKFNYFKYEFESNTLGDDDEDYFGGDYDDGGDDDGGDDDDGGVLYRLR